MQGHWLDPWLKESKVPHALPCSKKYILGGSFKRLNHFTFSLCSHHQSRTPGDEAFLTTWVADSGSCHCLSQFTMDRKCEWKVNLCWVKPLSFGGDVCHVSLLGTILKGTVITSNLHPPTLWYEHHYSGGSNTDSGVRLPEFTSCCTPLAALSRSRITQST